MCANNLGTTGLITSNSLHCCKEINPHILSTPAVELVLMECTHGWYRNIGISFAKSTIREDGSIEFALYGYGCVICSDSYMGVR